MEKEEVIEMLNSWENMEFYIQHLSLHPKKLTNLFDVVFDDSDPIHWRAAYLADKIADKNPELIEPFIPKMIEALGTTSNTSKMRHYLKLISQYPIPHESIDFLFNYSLETFTNASYPVAVRVHGMQILFEISEIETDLKPELIHIIENEIEIHPTPGIKSRGKKLIQKLQSNTMN